MYVEETMDEWKQRLIDRKLFYDSKTLIQCLFIPELVDIIENFIVVPCHADWCRGNGGCSGTEGAICPTGEDSEGNYFEDHNNCECNFHSCVCRKDVYCKEFADKFINKVWIGQGYY